MTLPKYDKSKRRKGFEQLPKGAYVIKILNVKEEPRRYEEGRQLTISFDIAEGEYKDFYAGQYRANSNEDKTWPYDAVYNLKIPNDNDKEYIWSDWNSFFSDLEDSNNRFVFDSVHVDDLKGKVIGGKFHIWQQEKNGNIYDHTKLRWTCVADDVRNGTAGQMPKDKLITSFGSRPETPETPVGTFVNFDPEKEGLPFA